MGAGRRGSRAVAIAAAYLSCISTTLVASAGPPSEDARPEDDSQIKRAREHFAAGLQLEDAGRWAAALEAFRAVAAVRTTPQVRYHVGLCLEHTGHLIEAATEFARAEVEARVSSDPEQQLVSARAGQRAAVVRSRTPRIAIESNGSPGGAHALTLRVDGQRRALEGRTVSVDPGPHRVVLERDGEVAADTTVVAREQDPAQVIVIRSGSPKQDAPSEASGPGPAPWIATGVTVAALAGAGLTALLRSSALGELDDACGSDRKTCPESVRSTVDRADTLTTWTNVLLVTAAASAIAAGALWLVLRPGRATSIATNAGRAMAPVLRWSF